MRKAISKEDILKLYKTEITIRLVDIRSATEYLKSHIPNAINIPVEELQNSTKLFANADTIVCICNHGKERSQQAAEILYSAGFENTYYLTGGVATWLNEHS